MATRPRIDISFKQLATTLIQRSERGIAILLLNDPTLQSITTRTYKSVADIDDSIYTTHNLAYIKSCMNFAPNEVVVISGNSNKFSDFAAEITKARSTGWIAAPGSVSETITKEWNLTDNTNSLGVEYDGSTWSDAGNHPQTYGGKQLTEALKMESKTTITFYAEKKGNLKMVTYSTTASPQIMIDGTSTKISEAGIAETVIEPGEHTITRNSTNAYIFGLYMEYEGSEMQADLASWIKSQENMDRTYKAVGTESGKDCKHYVYFDQSVIDKNGNPKTASDYLSSLLGILASCNVSMGCTNFLCSDISEVSEVEDIDKAIAEGQLVLTNDIGGVRIVTGINSLVTLNGNTETEDMQYVETVEAMDLIRDDIREVFKTTYQGRYKNRYMNQMLFIGSVNEYFDRLAGEDVLDSEFDNRAEIDVEAQRSAWLGTGKSEAADWDNDTVKRRAFKRSVFIAANIKILNCMENLKFTVTME